MASPLPSSAPPSSQGSTIDDPNVSENERTVWPAEKDLARDPDASSPPEQNSSRNLLSPRSKNPRRSEKKARKLKGSLTKGSFAWIQEGPQEGNTEDESSVVNEDHGKKSRWNQKKSDSRRNSDVDPKHPSSAATTVGTRRQANGTIGSVYSGNKIRHLKKDDGVPLWRKDIQYEFLRAVFEDKTAVFTRASDGQEDCNFADIYIDAMARSSKTSKVLKDKLQSDRAAAQNMAMICLLVNVGRMNTTLNFFPEMRAQLRTYHSIPALQAQRDSNAYKQLQDAPRLKSILKGASEDTEEPRTVEAVKAHQIPRTNPVNLIFVLAQYAPKISELHFSASVDFFDLVIRHTISSKTRSRAFLWLMWWYLQSNFTKEDALNNPFGSGTYEPGNADGMPIKVPDFEHLTEEQGNDENVDPEEEILYGEEKQKERKRILDDEEAENKPLKRVRKSAAGDEGLSDADSIIGRPSLAKAGSPAVHGTGSPAIRDSLGFAVLNPNFRHDPSTSQLGGQADSLDDDWEPVNPHPGRGRYKRVKTKDRESGHSSLQHQTSTMTSSSGRILLKTAKAQPSQHVDPVTPDNGAGSTPQPPGAAHPILHQYGPSTESITRGDAALGAASGTAGNIQRRPRPLTAHQMQVEASRRQRVESILVTKKEEVFAMLKAKRERSNFVLKAAKRIQNLRLGPNPNGGEEDDFGEEAESWLRVLLQTQRRLNKWSGDSKVVSMFQVGQQSPVAKAPLSGGQRKRDLQNEDEDEDVEMEDTIMEQDGSSPAAPDAAGLDDIDKSLLAERSDDDLGDDESEGISGEESDVEMD